MTHPHPSFPPPAPRPSFGTLRRETPRCRVCPVLSGFVLFLRNFLRGAGSIIKKTAEYRRRNGEVYMRFLRPDVLWHLLWLVPLMIVVFVVSGQKTAAVLKAFLGKHAEDPEYVPISRGKCLFRFFLLLHTHRGQSCPPQQRSCRWPARRKRCRERCQPERQRTGSADRQQSAAH